MPDTFLPRPIHPPVRAAAGTRLGVLCIAATLAWMPRAHGTHMDVTLDDLKRLPAYCGYTLRLHRTDLGPMPPGGGETLRKFEERVGCGSLWHYCSGLRDLNILGQFGYALAEFDYVLPRCAPNAAFKPEILTNKGRAFIGLGHYKDAVGVLTEAIRRDPKYVAAYAELSKVFLQVNNLVEARKILEEGLKQVPDSKLLQVRLGRVEKSATQIQEMREAQKAVNEARQGEQD